MVRLSPASDNEITVKRELIAHVILRQTRIIIMIFAITFGQSDTFLGEASDHEILTHSLSIFGSRLAQGQLLPPM